MLKASSAFKVRSAAKDLGAHVGFDNSICIESAQIWEEMCGESPASGMNQQRWCA